MALRQGDNHQRSGSAAKKRGISSRSACLDGGQDELETDTIWVGNVTPTQHEDDIAKLFVVRSSVHLACST
jgi:hypothetical protein